MTKDNDSKTIESIKSALECPCCSQMLESPLMFSSCGHCFCSMCIRRWLLTENCCPVCKGDRDENDLIANILLAKVIGHLRDEKQSLPESKRAKQLPPSKLPYVVYHLLSDEKLDDLLKSSGLPLRGTRDSRIHLHREYTLAYNAEIDAGNAEIDLAKVRKLAQSSLSNSAKTSIFHTASATKSTANKLPFRERNQALRKARVYARKKEQSKWQGNTALAQWRAVFSDLLNKPVYYNYLTKECTTERPPELELTEEDREEEVILVVEKTES